ncbi:hypothetical protein E2C01_071726 [Portunus trituberculatus]|uniref:Uncharacterized protein n=1 Tax=Portunus trituberculatus TaxID=210409 RepID=A0A5B7I561_PORTR|nr:hypothetical protein [Portunus trituberculatus]
MHGDEVVGVMERRTQEGKELPSGAILHSYLKLQGRAAPYRQGSPHFHMVCCLKWCGREFPALAAV